MNYRTYANGYIVSPVIMGRGKHFSDPGNGPGGSLYDPATAGQRRQSPWMIIDRHFAGEACRPFVIPAA